MELGLKGKVALVTGAGSQRGMGKAICLTLAQESCDIIVVDIDLKGAQKTAAEVEALGRKAKAVKTDITNSAEVDNMAKAVLAEFSKVDILINNAGASSPGKPFLEKTKADWDVDMNINFWGMVNCTRAVLPQMLSRKSGKIVNLASFGARTGGPNVASYCAAKGGVVAFSKSLAGEVAASGINVNCVAPGAVLTNFQKASQAPSGFSEAFLPMIPAKRFTTTQSIANMVVFLSSDVSCDIVGQTFAVDGGLTMY